jgi:GNAT superfamily N-acetyltransferase
LRGTQEVELHELNEQATPRIAQFWSTMIGGQTEELNDTLVRALAGLDAQVDPRFSRYATCRGAVVGIALCAVKDNALKTIAIAVAKPLRLQGIQTQLLAEVGQAALAQGATLQVFEAGRRQPDTQRLASRKKATCRASRVAFQLDLARTNQN